MDLCTEPMSFQSMAWQTGWDLGINPKEFDVFFVPREKAGFFGGGEVGVISDFVLEMKDEGSENSSNGSWNLYRFMM